MSEPGGHQPRLIGHVDMDAFFAAIEQRDDPTLRGQPVIVAGLGRRGVVSTASYEARQFGVHSALPTAIARQRCPHGIYRPPRMGVYQAVSKDVFEIFGRYTPLIEGLSLDEAFLDLTASQRLLGTGRAMATAIRAAIRTELGLTASVGLSANKSLAKMATEMAKPNGITELFEPAVIRARLDALPVGKLWTIGPKTAAALAAAGIEYIAQLRRAAPGLLHSILGARTATVLALAAGTDDRPVVAARDEKSIGAEQTFDVDISDIARVKAELLNLLDRSARRLRNESLVCQCIGLKLRTPPFVTHSRQRRLPAPISDTQTLLHVFGLLDSFVAEHREESPVFRLLGVSLFDLHDASALQPDLFALKRPSIDVVQDAVVTRFGITGMRRARSVQKEG